MTLEELAEYLKMAKRTLYGYAREGKIPAIKIGAAWRFRREEIDRWLDEQQRLTETSTKKRQKKT